MAKILLPIDGSEAAGHAVHYLINRVSNLKEPVEVLLLNVQHPMPGRRVTAGDKSLDGHNPEAMLRGEGNKILAPVRKLLEAAGIKHQHHVELGEPVELINHYARIYHCDEIVMGTRGTTSIFNLVLGSVTTKVLHVTTVPVVLVK